jgi:hypothetical protein
MYIFCLFYHDLTQIFDESFIDSVQGSLFRVPCSGLPVQGSLFRATCSGFPVQGSVVRAPCSGFLVQGSLFRVPCSGFPVQGSLFRVPCSGFPVQSSLFRVPCSGFRVQSSLFRAPCSGFPIQGSLFRVPCSGFPVQGSLASWSGGPTDASLRLTATPCGRSSPPPSWSAADPRLSRPSSSPGKSARLFSVAEVTALTGRQSSSDGLPRSMSS